MEQKTNLMIALQKNFEGEYIRREIKSEHTLEYFYTLDRPGANYKEKDVHVGIIDYFVKELELENASSPTAPLLFLNKGALVYGVEFTFMRRQGIQTRMEPRFFISVYKVKEPGKKDKRIDPIAKASFEALFA